MGMYIILWELLGVVVCCDLNLVNIQVRNESYLMILMHESALGTGWIGPFRLLHTSFFAIYSVTGMF